MTSDYVRICDLPDLQPGDLLWCLQKASGREAALYTMEGSEALWVYGQLLAAVVAAGDGGWSLGDGPAAHQSVKVLRRLRGVTREEIGRWDETHARLLAAPDLSAQAPLKVGDTLSGQEVNNVPEGTCLSTTAESSIRWRVAGGWQFVSFDGTRPGESFCSLDSRVFACERQVVAVGCRATDRTGLARELAAQGWEPARKWLQHHNLADAAPATAAALPPLKPGDRVAGRWDELPPGSVVDTGDGSGCPYLTRCEDKGWSWTGLVGPANWRSGLEYTSAWVERWPGAVLVGQVPVGTTGGAFVRALADQGYEPARKALVEHDSAAKPSALPKVGDKIRSQAELDALPPGAVVEMFDGVWQHATGGNWRPVSLSYDNWSHPMSSTRFGLHHDSKAKLVALNVLADDRVSFARALAAQGYEPAAKALRNRPPMPKPGDKLTAVDLDALPVGAVVDDGDKYIPWNLKTHDGWIMMGSVLEGEGSLSGCMWWKVNGTTLVALDAPTHDTAALRQWAAARGYAAAVELEAEAKKALDGRTEQAQTQDMTTQQPKPQTITIMPQAGESTAAFQERVRKSCDALAKVTSFARADEVAQSVVPQQLPSPAPSLLQRLTTSVKATGVGLVQKSWDRAQVKAVHVGIDAARSAAHIGLVELVEAFAGEKTALKVARVVQLPTVQAAEDLLLSVGADLAGRPALAAVARDRFAERTVDGATDLVVGHVVRIGSRAVAALRGADEAATTAIAEGSPVSAGQVGEAQS